MNDIVYLRDKRHRWEEQPYGMRLSTFPPGFCANRAWLTVDNGMIMCSLWTLYPESSCVFDAGTTLEQAMTAVENMIRMGMDTGS